jgi:methylated-DNA-[protein]-cysteine S-methyltransferase
MSTQGEHPVHYCLIATNFGPVGLAWSDQGLVRLQLPEMTGPSVVPRLLRGIEAEEADPPDWLAATMVKLQRYFTGTPTDLSTTPLDLEGVPDFHRALYLDMQALAWGETITYGELAARAGAPGAAQAVGQAMGKNPLPIIVPCHRVLASGNKLGGFSAPGGTSTKARLLAMEGVQLGTASGQLAFAF